MMSQEQNDLITRTGPKDACGRLMRMYWQPAALVDELQGPRPVRPVKLLGEDLVLFRDEQDRYGLIERHCAHRGADLAFGRREHGGLRCAFHGWLFDVSGQCLETPAEPAGSVLCKGIRQRAYPVVEKSGILWAYLGEGAPPAFPELDCFVAPEQPHLRLQGPLQLQLAAGARSRHRSVACLVPASLLRGRGHLVRLWQAVSRRLRRHRHADDQDPARI